MTVKAIKLAHIPIPIGTGQLPKSVPPVISPVSYVMGTVLICVFTKTLVKFGARVFGA
jgi:hypothetical protein